MDYMDTPQQAICCACGGSGVDDPLLEPVSGPLHKSHHKAWTRQMANRPAVLEGIDRYLGIDEDARLRERTSLTTFVHELLDALTDVSTLANQTRALPFQSRAPLVMDVLEGLACCAAETIHFLANRAHPVDPSDWVRMGEEQQLLRKLDENNSDPDPDPTS